MKKHLGEMRQAELDVRDNGQSHISDMLDQPRPSLTTLRLSACMVLIAPIGASHASGMVLSRCLIPKKTITCIAQEGNCRISFSC